MLNLVMCSMILGNAFATEPGSDDLDFLNDVNTPSETATTGESKKPVAQFANVDEEEENTFDFNVPEPTQPELGPTVDATDAINNEVAESKKGEKSTVEAPTPAQPAEEVPWSFGDEEDEEFEFSIKKSPSASEETAQPVMLDFLEE